MQNEITEFLEGVAAVAGSTQRKLGWLVGAGLVASASLAWQAYSSDSNLWWNVTKCLLIMLPSLVWCFVWSVLGQLREAPALAATMARREDGLFANFQHSRLQDKGGIQSVFRILRAFREEEGLGVVLDTIGSVTLLGNPFFAAFAFIMVAILIFFIMIAPLLLLL
ncbi:MAG: hypothetical protein HKN85_12080 [Gammaproteobacteria bacterium]|nr:hypothetical protein [Gammaproteobacteria bacterium]